MAPIICKKCKRKINNRDYLKCSVCYCTFDLDCVNISEKLFDIMKKENKAKWNCKSCKTNKQNKTNKSVCSSTPKTNVSTSMNTLTPVANPKPSTSKATPGENPEPSTSNATSEANPEPCTSKAASTAIPLAGIEAERNATALQNEHHHQAELQTRDNDEFVTMRKKCPSEGFMNASLPNLDSSTSSLQSESSWPNTSLPDLSSLQNKEMENLLGELSNLKLKLHAAEQEIDNLILEKSVLQKTIANQNRKITSLLNVCSSSALNQSLTKSSNKKKKKKKTKNSFEKSTMIPIDVTIATNNSSMCKEEPENVLERMSDDYKDKQTDSGKYSNSTIYILGGQQCSGMASILRHSRINTQFQEYRITSTIKPNAPCEEVLRTAETMNADKNDIIIVNIGENDKNPTKLCAELSFFLKSHYKPTVIVIGVKNNAYLNEKILNATLKMYCNIFDNCKFLDISDINQFDINFKLKMCNKLNIIIDTIYYDKKFLGYNKLVVRTRNAPLQPPPIKSKTHKVGTIPYYFEQKSKMCQSHKNTNCKTKIVQKTIPEYFSKYIINNFNASSRKHVEEKFFRKE